MDSEGPRRVQYSSCDQCRKARVACDAARTAKTTSRGAKSCSRCANRQQRCTFEWIREVRNNPPANGTRGKKTRRGASNGARHASSASLEAVTNDAHRYSFSNDLTARAISSFLLPVDDLDVDVEWLRAVYTETWETIFGHWMSRYGCELIVPSLLVIPMDILLILDPCQAPSFGDENIAESFISISSLCGQLDKWMAADSGRANDHTYPGFSDAFTDSETDHQSRMSLERVISAFAARWLPLVSSSMPSDAASTQEIIVRLWREARADMLNVINRPTYRSMLTLYLFGLCPIPEGVSDEEELSGMSGSLCVQASLQQVYMLRVRQRSLQFSGSKVSPVAEKTFSLSPDPVATNNFMNAESIAHWAALVFDTSASLTLSSRPILSSGLFGFEADWCWTLVRSCTELFQGTTTGWTGEMTESKANQVIAAGSMSKLRMWKLAAVFREALRDGHDEAAVNKVYNEMLQGIEQFNHIYGDLLEACQKRIHFLSQATKLRWEELILHYNLGILLAADAIETTERFDLLPRLSAARTEAEISILNVLKFGIENTYTITLRSGTSPSTNGMDDSRTVVPILAIDPYPHHVVAAVQLMKKAVDRDLATDRINGDTHANLNLILRRALDLLPGSSKSVVSARRQADLAAANT